MITEIVIWTLVTVAIAAWWQKTGYLQKFTKEMARAFYNIFFALGYKSRADRSAERHCDLMHKTARTELDVYGEVVSESVHQHMMECNTISGILHRNFMKGKTSTRIVETPTDTDMRVSQYRHCKVYGHSWTMDGKCAFCYATYPPQTRLPDPGRAPEKAG